MTGPLLSDMAAGGVLMLTLNRPAARNAINDELRAALRAAFVQAAGDAAVRAVVLAGTGGNFCAGGDIASMAAMSPDDAKARMADVAETARAVAACDKPVIACVKGHAAGAGIGLALLCDEVIADADARFTFSFARIGLGPDWGLTATLPRRVGQATAQRLIGDGTQLTAAAALEMRLIDDVAGGHDALVEASDRAIVLAAAPAPATEAAKSQFRRLLAELVAALDREGEAQARCFASPEFAARLAEFQAARASRKSAITSDNGKEKTMSHESFIKLAGDIAGTIGARPLDKDLEAHLSATYPPDGDVFTRIEALCSEGEKEGWLCNREAGGIRFSRPVKPGEGAGRFSVDVVRMQDVKGPHHVHTTGEIGMIMPIDGEPRFDGMERGWYVYEAGSDHWPTVTGGTAYVLYFLPEGAIEFTGK